MIAYEWILILTLATYDGVAIDHINLHSTNPEYCKEVGSEWVKQNDRPRQNPEFICVRETGR